MPGGTPAAKSTLAYFTSVADPHLHREMLHRAELDDTMDAGHLAFPITPFGIGIMAIATTWLQETVVETTHYDLSLWNEIMILPPSKGYLDIYVYGPNG